MNRFRLWLNKNSFKIILTIAIIAFTFFIIKISNNYYKKVKENTKKEIAEENAGYTYYDSNIEDVSGELGFDKTEEDDKEYSTIEQATEKLIQTIYKANTTEDNEEFRAAICDMLTDQLVTTICYSSRYDDSFNIQEGILDYVLYINDKDDCTIKDIYKYSETDNVARYIVTIEYKDENEEANRDIYMVMNIDYNNNTFSYDGNLNAFDEIKRFDDITEIEINENNTL